METEPKNNNDLARMCIYCGGPNDRLRSEYCGPKCSDNHYNSRRKGIKTAKQHDQKQKQESNINKKLPQAETHNWSATTTSPVNSYGVAPSKLLQEPLYRDWNSNNLFQFTRLELNAFVTLILLFAFSVSRIVKAE